MPSKRVGISKDLKVVKYIDEIIIGRYFTAYRRLKGDINESLKNTKYVHGV